MKVNSIVEYQNYQHFYIFDYQLLLSKCRYFYIVMFEHFEMIKNNIIDFTYSNEKNFLF